MQKLKPYLDRHNFCMPKLVNGKKEIRIFPDRRAAITWPSPQNPAYCTIFGLEDIVGLTGKMPMVQLIEGRNPDIEKMLDKLVPALKKSGCTWVFCDKSDKYRSVLAVLNRYLRNRNLKQYSFYDTSEWDCFEAALPHLKSEDDAPRIAESSILYRQLQNMNPDLLSIKVNDRVDPQQKHYAYNALAQIVMSYVLYPWEKPKKRVFNGPTEGYR